MKHYETITAGPGATSSSGTSAATLATRTIQIERKTFSFALMENGRGRFLRVTEGAAGHRNNIIIPCTGLQDFAQLVSTMSENPSAAAM